MLLFYCTNKSTRSLGSIESRFREILDSANLLILHRFTYVRPHLFLIGQERLLLSNGQPIFWFRSLRLLILRNLTVLLSFYFEFCAHTPYRVFWDRCRGVMHILCSLIQSTTHRRMPAPPSRPERPGAKPGPRPPVGGRPVPTRGGHRPTGPASRSRSRPPPARSTTHINGTGPSAADHPSSSHSPSSSSSSGSSTAPWVSEQ